MTIEKLQLPDGRWLALARFGAAAGAPVYFFHGFPGSRLQAQLIDDRARDAGLAIVAFDRPGFGASSPAPARTISGIAEDVARLADHLGHVRFGVLGVSCGGPYALATAAALPTRVVHVGLMGGMGPMDVAGIRDEQLTVLKAMFGLARLHPWLVAPLLALDRLMFLRSPARAVAALSKLLSPPDQAMLRSMPDHGDMFARGLAEAYRKGIAGAMTEARLIASPRGFSLEDLKIPVDLYQGGHDRHVPPTMGRYLAERIPGARYHYLEGEGHLSILAAAFDNYAVRVRSGLGLRTAM